ncbi:MAG TPA: bifunctional phosphopantothenoylcysteine decarboxylase/phosphopantothenate--cysteine ligase CoaBC [Alphaproteobacteria bacterium]|nr:bifunctional phosphopantothenoylcysteine decarboxylase/phosphopantothenate--cysteine ligase CoaBC [Alphaproteobacteria bacterium]
MLAGKRILLIISGGIAAYKSLELIRGFKKSGANVRCILTKGGSHFVTPLSVAALTEEPVYDDLWSLKDETEMGHIRLSREADIIVVAPASANLLAQMTHGLAEDLASTTLLATNRPVLVCPAMNPMMWNHTATQENLTTLRARGVQILMPTEGDMACGETGTGRMQEPEDILHAVIAYFQNHKPLAGRSAVVTSGPTHEPIDPVRFIGNRSSGKQGHAIAQALNDAGASVTLVTGPVNLPDPLGLQTVRVQTAAEMYAAVQEALPADIAVCAAAVSDWRVMQPASNKIKKNGGEPPLLQLSENQDILKSIAAHDTLRPSLVIGFAAETENLLENAKAKRLKKSCDWIIANDVSDNVFGAEENHVYLIKDNHMTEWPRTSKEAVARDLTQEIIDYFNPQKLPQAAE